jgi:hypothetical protein
LLKIAIKRIRTKFDIKKWQLTFAILERVWCRNQMHKIGKREKERKEEWVIGATLELRRHHTLPSKESPTETIPKIPKMLFLDPQKNHTCCHNITIFLTCWCVCVLQAPVTFFPSFNSFPNLTKRNGMDICFNFKFGPWSFNCFRSIKLFYFVKLIINLVLNLFFNITRISYQVNRNK